MSIAELLAYAKTTGASDLHLSAGATPMVRVNGDMRKLDLGGTGPAGPSLSDPGRVRDLIHGFLSESQRARLVEEWEIDCAISLPDGSRFRANVFTQERGLGAVIRVIPNEIKTPDELGLPPVFREIAELENGLVLVTGPTGSGKSTTLAALIDHVNRTRRGHIITIEDPIEFVHGQKNCMVNQREVGAHSRGFQKALRSALREDPDVILVGEMRDHETIGLALTAAETGHLVFGTLHTSSAPRTVERIVNVFPGEEQAQVREMVSGSIQAIIAQVLVKRKTGGRVAAHEVLIATDAARAMIREGKGFQLLSLLQTGARHGMQTLDQSLERLVREGAVDKRVADDMLRRLGGVSEDAASRERGVRTMEETTPAPQPAPAPAPLGVPRRHADVIVEKPKPAAAKPPRGQPVLVLDTQAPKAAPPQPPPADAPPKPHTHLDTDALVAKTIEMRKQMEAKEKKPGGGAPHY